MQTANRKSGYTLIELLVGLTIIAIVFSIGFAGYRDFSRRQAVAGVTKSIQSDLRNAQQLALTGQKPDTCTRLSGYTFASVSSTSYSISANCSNGSIEVKNVNLVDTTLSAGSVMFKVLGQGTDLPDSLIFTVTHTSGATPGTITIGVGGDIK
jgi:prepilin-type N-terminal cleavage/methylation domain-containing protein